VQARHEKLARENATLHNTVEERDHEIEYLKEEILACNLGETEQSELLKLRNEALESKARTNKLSETVGKLKEENGKLMKEGLGLEESLSLLREQNEKLVEEMGARREGEAALEKKVRELEEALRARGRELETSMPYLNKVIEEKKNN
jgi:chromosome segregation ATPase